MNRRGFLARLFAAPIVALALLKAPTCEAHTEGSFGKEPLVNGYESDLDEIRRRYIEPAIKAMQDDMDARMLEFYEQAVR